MFCSNCGKENDDGVAFCSNCGKSLTGGGERSELKKMDNYPLINLSSKLFYPVFEIGLWVLLIFGTIFGGIIGSTISKLTDYQSNGGAGFFAGFIIGFIISFILMILSGGIISIFLKMNENIEKIKNKQ